MTLGRAFPLVLALAVLPIGPAAAQQVPPSACQHLLTFRDETQKHAQVLQAAGQKRVSPEELCKLFKVYLAAERKMVMGLEEHHAACGVPAEVAKQVKVQHAKSSQMGKQICEVAAMPGRPPRFDAPVPQCTEKTLRPGVPCVD